MGTRTCPPYVTALLPQVQCEHPYNLSFIGNEAMLALFGPMRLLRAPFR